MDSHQRPPPGENTLLAASHQLDAAQRRTPSKWLLSIWTNASYFILISGDFIQKPQTVSKSRKNKKKSWLKRYNLQTARFKLSGTEAISQIVNPLGSQPWL